MEQKFDQKKYINEWRKKNYRRVSIDLSIAEKKELDDLCIKKNITKKDILKKGIEYFKNK